MTVSSVSRRAGPFTGNGVTTSFPFTFKVFAAADLEVTHTDTTSELETILTLDSDYSVTLNADQDASPGGSITYPLSGDELAATETLAVVSDAAYEQDLDISNAGRFLPQVVEDALDKLAILTQQLKEKLGRALLFSVNESTVAGTLPAAADRAGLYLAFDASGDPTASSGTGADAGLRADLAASTGSALAGHAPAGVGAVTTTVQAELRRIAAAVGNVVASITALRAVDKKVYADAFVTGYYSAGDGGGGAYWYDASDTTSADNGGTVIVATDGGRWKLIYTGTLSVKQFGAKGDTATDDTTAIRAAIVAATELYFPPGAYKCALLTINKSMNIYGAGKLLSIILSTETTDNSIEIACGAGPLSAVFIHDLGISATTTKTAGFAIKESTSAGGALYKSKFSELDISDKQWSGIALVSTVFVTLENIDVNRVGAGGAGVLLRGASAAPYSIAGNIIIRGLRVLTGAGSGAVGLWIDSYSEGLYIDQCTFETTGLDNGIKISNTLAGADSVKNIFMSQVICDANAVATLSVDGCRTVHAENSWFCTSLLSVGVVLSNCFDIKFTGCSITNNAQHGVAIADTCTAVLLNGCGIQANGIATANTYSGVQVNYNAVDFSIIGCQFARAGTTSNHKYSVEVLGGTSERFIVTGNNLIGFTTAAIYDGAASANKVIANNIIA